MREGGDEKGGKRCVCLYVCVMLVEKGWGSDWN